MFSSVIATADMLDESACENAKCGAQCTLHVADCEGLQDVCVLP